jgi:hypothetical protein
MSCGVVVEFLNFMCCNTLAYHKLFRPPAPGPSSVFWRRHMKVLPVQRSPLSGLHFPGSSRRHQIYGRGGLLHPRRGPRWSSAPAPSQQLGQISLRSVSGSKVVALSGDLESPVARRKGREALLCPRLEGP